jgi:uncharacterized integral membrane protein
MSRMLVLLLIIGSLAILVLQNWSPVLPLVVFGGTTIALPLAVWISLFMGAGVLVSLSLQLLNYRPRPQKTARSTAANDPDLPPPPPQRDIPKAASAPQPQSDWESSGISEDWTVPKASKPPSRPSRLDFEKRSPPETSRPSEPPQPPQPSTQTPQNRVYDANFRVIDQPPQPPEPVPTDEEDWGFEDEDFETEYRRNWPSN